MAQLDTRMSHGCVQKQLQGEARLVHVPNDVSGANAHLYHSIWSVGSAIRSSYANANAY